MQSALLDNAALDYQQDHVHEDRLAGPSTAPACGCPPTAAATSTHGCYMHEHGHPARLDVDLENGSGIDHSCPCTISIPCGQSAIVRWKHGHASPTHDRLEPHLEPLHDPDLAKLIFGSHADCRNMVHLSLPYGRPSMLLWTKPQNPDDKPRLHMYSFTPGQSFTPQATCPGML